MTPPRTDLRTAVLGGVAWTSAVAALLLPAWLVLLALATACATAALARHHGRLRPTHLAWLVAAAAVAGSALLHAEQVARSGLAGLAEDRASVRVQLRVASDPVLREGRFQRYVIFHANLTRVTGRGQRIRLHAPVLVIADPSWHEVRISSEIRAAGRLDVADDRQLAGVLTTRGPPQLIRSPPRLLRGVDALRTAIRTAVAAHPAAPRALVPALVDGDEAGMDPRMAADFRVSGLTHLLAVSGTNLTLIVGFWLILARWCRVRARGLIVVGVVGVLGFVLLARTDPSVVRAAAMGSVALVGMGHNGRGGGVRALGVAVLGLMLFDPWLATSIGFGLSVCATAGILLLAPGWRDSLMRWLPRWVAEAIAVPLAAQLACTPLVAAISGQVSLVAVLANMLVAVVVGPATVLGLLGGMTTLVWPPLGQLVATPAIWCAEWIIAVAHGCAHLPVAAVAWSSGSVGIVVLTVVCLGMAMVLGDLLARKGVVLGVSGLLVFVVLVPLPTPGWPPPGWVLVACDVGQGDALVLNAGAGSVVMVDTGPDPGLVDGCLRRLHVRRVSLVLLTHFHSDHVDGLSGVLRGRRVRGIWVSPVADPLSGVHQVRAVAQEHRVPVTVASYGETGAAGQLRWQVLAPSRLRFADSDSPPNDGSLVLLVEVRGVRILMMGDEERPSQAELASVVPGLHADVLKVAHHGSSKQDEDLVDSLGARLAVISVGAENDYGHPAAATLRLLRRAGMKVSRTDQDGDVAVIVDEHGGLRVRSRRP